MKNSATEISMATDMRRARANALLAAVMEKVGPHLRYDSHRDVARSLFELFYDSGVDTVTDEDRARAGLPPRGELGWTAAELRTLEAARLSQLLAPIGMVLAKPAAAERARGDDLLTAHGIYFAGRKIPETAFSELAVTGETALLVTETGLDHIPRSEFRGTRPEPTGKPKEA